MKLFSCGFCGHTVYFHNVSCNRCGHRLGFEPQRLELLAFLPLADGGWQPVGEADGAAGYRLCANYAEFGTCNWMVPAADPGQLCAACRLNRTIPDLSVVGNVERWRLLQKEKNRLVYGLLRLRLPVVSKLEAPALGLAFDFIGDPATGWGSAPGVVTGHQQGLITIDISEADDAVREQVRQQMAEPYRTVLGHFRHESGHYYWDRLVRDSIWLERFRGLFGDERVGYDLAMQNHYSAGPPPDWSQRHVSAYAASHPWEDWAETWSHYLHICDTLETAWQFGVGLAPRLNPDGDLNAAATFDPYACEDFQPLADCWFPLTVALNSLNRSMGQADVYPFVLPPTVVEKLAFVHELVRQFPRPVPPGGQVAL